MQASNVAPLRCSVCSGQEFGESSVLWPELVSAWQLSPVEVAYIDRQQGFHCVRCNNNLRAMGLAAAIVKELNFAGSLDDLCRSDLSFGVLEINRAGNLTHFLQNVSGHRLIEYPDFDMQDLAIPESTFDLVVHSDTLEHIPNPVRGLAECRRVLKSNGKCIFTVPIIVGRMSRFRDGLAPSYHGQSKIYADDHLVCAEFGVDIWRFVLEAGFSSCEIFSFEYPAALVLVAKK